MNGLPLEPDHGFPVRIIIPGQIGGRMVKVSASLLSRIAGLLMPVSYVVAHEDRGIRRREQPLRRSSFVLRILVLIVRL